MAPNFCAVVESVIFEMLAKKNYHADFRKNSSVLFHLKTIVCFRPQKLRFLYRLFLRLTTEGKHLKGQKNGFPSIALVVQQELKDYKKSQRQKLNVVQMDR